MTRRRRAPLVIATGSAVALMLLSGCSAPEPQETAPPEAVPSSPVATPEATASEPALPDPTCENIIREASLDELQSQGWEYEQGPFMIGETEIDAGVSCTWTNAAEPGGNILQFGWAPLTAAETTEAQRTLESQGWIREEGDDGVYLTEDPSFALNIDGDGYGVTYFFGEGYAQVADVKQGLVVIERR
ncbi:hypothetical protein ACU6RU_06705 [Microbacterium sp. F1-18]|jgi:hypothetical protein|uniref:hypothetical protein n=1 Tax=unclassified Microbacterium TaxID=2609290 RepID=UPI000E74AA3A|nr:hypothetical protein [Microbacterium sp. AG238]RKE63287.1 hypothetical protein DEU36_0487 [Microbacterium sp. AG238]